jgi:hypothetical protein
VSLLDLIKRYAQPGPGWSFVEEEKTGRHTFLLWRHRCGAQAVTIGTGHPPTTCGKCGGGR